jgi:hypothetical protein
MPAEAQFCFGNQPSTVGRLSELCRQIRRPLSVVCTGYAGHSLRALADSIPLFDLAALLAVALRLVALDCLFLLCDLPRHPAPPPRQDSPSRIRILPLRLQTHLFFGRPWVKPRPVWGAIFPSASAAHQFLKTRESARRPAFRHKFQGAASR